MSLLTQNNNPQAQLSEAERRARRVRQHIASSWRQILSMHQQGMSLVWDLPEGTSAQDVLNELGTDAAEAFQVSGQLAELIASHDASQVRTVPEGVTVTANQDGSVTLS